MAEEDHQGFVFAFLRYSRLEHASWVQRAVSVATWSDSIHVAAIPVPARGTLGPTAYTAFIQAGFEEQDVREVLACPAYDYLFVPVPDPARWREGLRFLRELRGADYNYWPLLFILMVPRFIRRRWSVELPHWLTHERSTVAPDGQVFCSQLCLMLCYICGVLDHFVMDPAACTPSDLKHLLLRSQAAEPIHEGLLGSWRLLLSEVDQ